MSKKYYPYTSREKSTLKNWRKYGETRTEAATVLQAGGKFTDRPIRGITSQMYLADKAAKLTAVRPKRTSSSTGTVQQNFKGMVVTLENGTSIKVPGNRVVINKVCIEF